MILDASAGRFSNCELLIFDDGSSDRTAEVAAQLAERDHRIRVIRNPGNMGIGYSYRKGVELAAMSHIAWIAGDAGTMNVCGDFERVFDAIGQADIVVPYLAGDTRPLVRRFLSQFYVRSLNLLFGLKLKYYHHANVYRAEWIKGMRITRKGAVGVAEALIRSLKAGQTFVEVGIPNRDIGGNSSQLRFRNVVRVITSVLGLWWEVRVHPFPKPR